MTATTLSVTEYARRSFVSKKKGDQSFTLTHLVATRAAIRRKLFAHNKKPGKLHPMPNPPQPFYIPLPRRRFLKSIALASAGFTVQGYLARRQYRHALN